MPRRRVGETKFPCAESQRFAAPHARLSREAYDVQGVEGAGGCGADGVETGMAPAPCGAGACPPLC